MSISSLQKGKNAGENYWDLYPRRFTAVGSRSSSATTFQTIISISGEGYIDFAALAAYGNTGGGSGNQFGLRLTVDGVVLILRTFTGSNSGQRFAGFYSRNTVRANIATSGAYVFSIGEGTSLSTSSTSYLGAIAQVAAATAAPVNTPARATFPLGEEVKVLEAPIFFKSSLVAEVYNSGYFAESGAVITGGIK